ncbi:vitamin K epoxide reductase family protein [Streptomyces sp. DSM 40750]|uniref:vitamin K epoxide reductase family protein n=1 Tax=Streptomyces sp. DSM 40750 TaxID=2801030 RepID=UPI00214D0F5E|nr:vitamin K epoxide reductase family protein [Streptomyces sp. DSM 40750]UUU19009.1 vitamin K epoxide reductase family protein [Streptomyces sp. DSM 40750]UUU27649.1 vitamin K epoxide reductase family protein [Streptomyces sp. DSM 40750]
MSPGPALARAATTTRRPHTVGAGRRTGWVMVLTGTVGWLASFQLTVDDWRLLRDPSYQPPCNISPVVSCGSVMSSPQGSVFGFPNMLLGLGAFAAVTALGVAVLTGARLHRKVWIALDAGALVTVAFVHWLIGQSLYELNKLCPYCAVVWVVTIALFWYVSLHCLERGIIPMPSGVLAIVRDTHWMLLGAWYGVIALLVLTRFWAYWSSLL